MNSQIFENIGKEKLGPQCSSDNLFTKKARLLQSIYRVDKTQSKCGVGPNENSINQHSLLPSIYGNMLVKGELTGENFYFPETFEYAHLRINNKKKEETIDGYRLFNNLLSSMPLAFNLFHPLIMMKENKPELINKIFKELFPLIQIESVEEIKIEFIPTPISKYTNDKSAMDAAILFTDIHGCKMIIAIETKYTDSLGTNKAKDNSLKYDTATSSELFIEKGIEHIALGCTQIYRNFLLTEKFRMTEGLSDSYSIVLAPKDHPSTEKEIDSLVQFLKPEYQYKLKKYSLEDFVNVIKVNCKDEYVNWIDWFYNRYLDFSKAASLNF